MSAGDGTVFLAGRPPSPRAWRPVTKFNGSVDDVTRLPDMLRYAFRVATTGSPGPVHLQLQGNEGQLDRHVGLLDDIVEPEFAVVPPLRPRPDDESARAALTLLEAAARPVIVAGGGVRWSGAGSELVALAEALGIPVATSANGRAAITGGCGSWPTRRSSTVAPTST
jgi:acetolactate synthase-1/2/3 large subunit